LSHPYPSLKIFLCSCSCCVIYHQDVGSSWWPSFPFQVPQFRRRLRRSKCNTRPPPSPAPRFVDPSLTTVISFFPGWSATRRLRLARCYSICRHLYIARGNVHGLDIPRAARGSVRQVSRAVRARVLFRRRARYRRGPDGRPSRFLCSFLKGWRIRRSPPEGPLCGVAAAAVGGKSALGRSTKSRWTCAGRLPCKMVPQR
jgi:hypothetical protein